MKRSVTAVFVALVATQSAMAEPRDWDAEIELGLLLTTGNTKESNLNSRLGLKHEIESWRNLGEFSSAYSKGDGHTTSEKYRAELETNYKFTQDQYWFLRGWYDDDRFSGYDYQTSVTTGYGQRVWEAGERSYLDLSAGLGYRVGELREPDADGHNKEEQGIGRLAARFDYEISDTALFRQKLSSEIGLDDGASVNESETSLQATIRNNLSMKLAYRVKNVSDAPADSKSTDTETSISLLYGF